MFLVWGWRTRRKALEEGTFFSPATGMDGPYRLVELRRWFTLFFLPVIPLKVIGTYVECAVTKKLYETSVLANPTSADLIEQISAGSRDLVAAVASADGAVTAAQRDVALEVVGARVEGYDKETLRADVGRVTADSLSERMRFLASALNQQGKENLLADACRVLTADGPAGAKGRGLVEQAGRDLGMSVAHVRGVVDTAVNADHS
jgi:hypothetical protein